MLAAGSSYLELLPEDELVDIYASQCYNACLLMVDEESIMLKEAISKVAQDSFDFLESR
jgi:hypothetical protein